MVKCYVYFECIVEKFHDLDNWLLTLMFHGSLTLITHLWMLFVILGVLYKFYAFMQEQSFGILTVPLWMGQPWFPKLLNMLVDCSFILPKGAVVIPHDRDARHPLHKNLRLMAPPVSRNSTRIAAFPQGAVNSIMYSWRRSTAKQNWNVSTKVVYFLS